jgi:hypothetical protein
MEKRFLEKLTIPLTAQKFYAFYAARNFFIVSTKYQLLPTF